MSDEDRVPHGWRTNPSSWTQRRRSVALSALGLLTTTYIALSQFGVVSPAWDPFFGHASRAVLESPISYVFSIPVSVLGSFAFAVVGVTGAFEGPERWRTSPWVTLVFGAIVLTVGVASVSLVVAQALFVDAWSTVCLLSAAFSLVLVGASTDETLASLQYLRQVYDYRGSLWRAFWKGSRVRSRANESER